MKWGRIGIIGPVFDLKRKINRLYQQMQRYFLRFSGLIIPSPAQNRQPLNHVGLSCRGSTTGNVLAGTAVTGMLRTH